MNALLRAVLCLAILGCALARSDETRHSISRASPLYELHDTKIVSHQTCRHNNYTASRSIPPTVNFCVVGVQSD